jgi:hypothetical protein
MTKDQIKGAIAVAVVALSIAWLVHNRRRAPAPSPTTAVAAHQKNDRERRQAPEQERQEIPAAVKRQREILDLEMASGLQQVALKTTNDSTATVSVTVRPQARCMPGDLDIIAKDLEGAPARRIILTVEPLAAKTNFKPLSREVSEKELFRGFTRDFKIPTAAASTPLGIYLCRDADQTGECGKKSVGNIDDLATQLGDPAKADATRRADHVYFFQLLIQTPDRLLFPSSVELGGDQEKNLAKYLRLTTDGKQESAGALNRAKELIGAVSSLPGQPENDGIVLTLPYRDSKCWTTKRNEDIHQTSTQR